MDRLWGELNALREKKRVSFDELDRLIKRIINAYEHVFPRFKTNQKGSRVVYSFGNGLFPLTLEREHRGRDCVPPKFAKIALNHIEDVLTFAEGQP